MAYIFIVICVFLISFCYYIKVCKENEQFVKNAADIIEETMMFVKEHKNLLGYNGVTMSPLINGDKGFAVEFFGFNSAYKDDIEELVSSFVPDYKIVLDENDDLIIRCFYMAKYKGTWNIFNKSVCNEMKKRSLNLDITK